MINANELKIGNIALNSDGSILTIDGAYIKWISEGSVYNIEPIHLTEKVLLACGYENDMLEDEYFRCSCEVLPYGWIEFDKNKNMFVISNSDGGKIEIPFLHDLQNAYFYNMGKKELPINIEKLT